MMQNKKIKMLLFLGCLSQAIICPPPVVNNNNGWSLTGVLVPALTVVTGISVWQIRQQNKELQALKDTVETKVESERWHDLIVKKLAGSDKKIEEGAARISNLEKQAQILLSLDFVTKKEMRGAVNESEGDVLKAVENAIAQISFVSRSDFKEEPIFGRNGKVGDFLMWNNFHDCNSAGSGDAEEIDKDEDSAEGDE